MRRGARLHHCPDGHVYGRAAEVCRQFERFAVHSLFEYAAPPSTGMQKVQLLTDWLVFTKLASQLTLSKIAELGIIPVIFVFMTAVSYACAWGLSRTFGFKKRAKNFVTAMVSTATE